ncbi:cofactor-independent phosphoglycerate mutase [Desulfurispira natronophila]|uniref:2,3-bisphosphoglycerate-independent phosphoglycerate mutase n=1 Tax=Desulfurispira natronophila TaxID=682562 RepID=A0A7W7Y2J9_9BACT|nr:cofactor-independent phosphoglycerate mutase [Desulfurispira natronophila]MBB5020906.1 2,3-bisphosphoglycerate-independent phosphoglycerate mutase [Desulfurispira natronophila]
MKQVVLLGDGMSDHPLPQFDNRTPLQIANTPNMDRIAHMGIGGSTINAPEHLPVGSDICNLSVLGYRLDSGYTGRSPIEAAAMGVELSDNDVAFRCNLVTLTEDGSVMKDFSAGHIDSAEAADIIAFLKHQLDGPSFTFHAGVSYRHLLVWHDGIDTLQTTPPHDISDKKIAPHLPFGDGSQVLQELMNRSQEILKYAPVNQARRAQGKPEVSSIWLWGQGRRPSFQSFYDLYGKSGAIITAVDLMRGVAKCIGFKMIEVEGATGWIDTNYRGKAQACIDVLPEVDLVYLHVESPDEAGHAGRADYKIQAIEDFDAQVVGPVLEHLDSAYPEAYRIVTLPDHPTPIAVRTHTRDRVPFAMAGAGIKADSCTRYNETLLEDGSVHLNDSTHLMKMLLGQDLSC